MYRSEIIVLWSVSQKLCPSTWNVNQLTKQACDASSSWSWIEFLDVSIGWSASQRDAWIVWRRLQIDWRDLQLCKGRCGSISDLVKQAN